MNPALYLGLIFTMFAFVVNAVEEGSTLRAGASFNTGSVNVNSLGEQRTEGPFGMNFNLEHSFSSRLTVGVDHLRSFQLSPMATSVSASSIYAKSYYFLPQPSWRPDSTTATSSYFFTQDIVPYFGLGLGFVQSSLLPKTDDGKGVSSVGLSLSIKNGIEIPVLSYWGFRSELNYTTTVAGTGSIVFMHLMLGLFYNL